MFQSDLDRRRFLKLGLLGASAGACPVFIQKTAAAVFAATPEADRPEAGSGRILIVLQMTGGNDGLSTVVPYASPVYGRARTSLRIREGEVLRLDDHAGLHPNLRELREIYDRGAMAILPAAGYPNPNRSHFLAMDIWQAADPTGARRGTGWLGRSMDLENAGSPGPLASINLGGSVPLALKGEKSRPVSLENPAQYQLRASPRARDALEGIGAAGGGPGGGDAGAIRQLDFLRRTATAGAESSEAIRRATQGYRALADYPPGNRLAEDLRRIAALIAAGLPTRVYYVSQGGFDTHANQRGQHDNLMKVFSSAVAAFVKDLGARNLLDRVLILTFSEFGRRVQENASRGTDHGAAGPMFLIGGKVRGGIRAPHPDLERLAEGDIAMTVDFRRVYAAVLDDWLGVSSESILGARWPSLELLQGVRKPAAF